MKVVCRFGGQIWLRSGGFLSKSSRCPVLLSGAELSVARLMRSRVREAPGCGLSRNVGVFLPATRVRAALAKVDEALHQLEESIESHMSRGANDAVERSTEQAVGYRRMPDTWSRPCVRATRPRLFRSRRRRCRMRMLAAECAVEVRHNSDVEADVALSRCARDHAD